MNYKILKKTNEAVIHKPTPEEVKTAREEMERKANLRANDRTQKLVDALNAKEL